MKSTAPVLLISPNAVWLVVKRYLTIFVSGFLTAVGAGLIHVTSIPTLKALVWCGFAAGAAAIVHLMTAKDPSKVSGSLNPKLESALYTIGMTAIATFVTLFGTTLVTGASHLTSLPSLFDLVSSAVAAGVAGVVTFLTGLLPKQKTS